MSMDKIVISEIILPLFHSALMQTKGCNIDKLNICSFRWTRFHLWYGGFHGLCFITQIVIYANWTFVHSARLDSVWPRLYGGWGIYFCLQDRDIIKNMEIYQWKRMVLGALVYIHTITPWLMEPGGSMHIHKGSPIIPIQRRINLIPRIDTYFFKVHSNIVLPSTRRSP